MIRHDLVIVCEDDALSEALAAQLAPGPHRVLRVRSVAEGLPLFAEDATERGLLCVYDRAPSAFEAQSLINLARLDGLSVICMLHSAASPGGVDTLLAVGIHEIIPLESGKSGLLSLVTSGMHREQERRALERGGARAALKRDIAEALSAARSPREILEAYCDGVLALGAHGVAVYEPCEGSAKLAIERGLRIERQAVLSLAPEQRHPANSGVMGALWLDSCREAQDQYPDFVPYLPELALGVLPVGGTEDPLVLVTHPASPDDAERYALVQLGAQVRDAVRRAHYQVQLEEDRDADRKLLGVVSHDLRNPLNTIRLAASLASGRARGPELEALTARIERTARNGQRLVEDLLTFVEASRGPIALHRASVDVRSVVSCVVADAGERNETDRSLSFVPTADDATAQVDVAHLEQAVANLLASALAHAPRGTEVCTRVSADGHAVYIDVETRGERIEAPALALLFAPFERAAKLGERGSLALGQFVVGKIAVAHGGRVWAEPRNEGGLRLSMQLPKRAPAPDAAIPRGAPRTARAPTPAPPHDRELSELNERVRSDALRQLLRLWWTARGEAELPHPWSIERRQLLALAPDIVQATVSLDDDGKPVFSWTSIGPRLERRLRGTLYADLASGEHHSREQYDCYLRCYTTRAPAYDYVRQRGAHPLSFERLLLPLARTREQGPSEILGIVLFEGVDR